tara:strand:- start:4228 stop:5874 length:1647 start_codon:yes stop_codon:yes gene_type:complete
MASSEDILLTFKTETGEVTKSLADIQKGVEGVDNEIKKTAKNTSKIGKGLRAAGKLGATGFKALGTAIAATGIGALIGLIAGLTAKMAENKKIAEAFEVVVSAVGAAFNILVQRIEPLAGVIINAFSNPVESIKSLGNAIKNNIQTRLEGLLEFIPALGESIKLLFAGEWEEAGKVAADAAGKVVLGVEDISDKVAVAAEAVKEFATEFKEEATKAVVASSELTQETQKLRDQQRDLNVEYAEARAEIEQLKQKRDDERLSIEERVAAAQRASDLDQEFAQRREAIANAEVALIQREINVQGDSIERQERLAEARIAAAEAAESSAAVQTELMTSIFGLEQEALAIEDEKIAKAKEVADLEIQLALEAKARKEKDAAEDQARNEAIFNSRIQFATQALGALSALNDAFTGDSEKEQKKAFQRNKAIGISTAIINTAGAIVGAINPAVGGAGIPLGLPGAALAAATGVAQIATIAKSRFNSGGTPPPPPGDAGGGGGGTGSIPPTPQLDLGFLGAGSGQSGFRSYVIASEVSNSQQANQRINDQASLVG